MAVDATAIKDLSEVTAGADEAIAAVVVVDGLVVGKERGKPIVDTGATVETGATEDTDVTVDTGAAVVDGVEIADVVEGMADDAPNGAMVGAEVETVAGVVNVPLDAGICAGVPKVKAAGAALVVPKAVDDVMGAGVEKEKPPEVDDAGTTAGATDGVIEGTIDGATEGVAEGAIDEATEALALVVDGAPNVKAGADEVAAVVVADPSDPKEKEGGKVEAAGVALVAIPAAVVEEGTEKANPLVGAAVDAT